jgi:hypothetical protein
MSTDSDLALWERKLADAQRAVADCEEHIATLEAKKQQEMKAEAVKARQAAEQARKAAASAGAREPAHTLADELFG